MYEVGCYQSLGVQGEQVSSSLWERVVWCQRCHPLEEPRGHTASSQDSPSPALCRSVVASPPLSEINMDYWTLLTWYVWWILVSFAFVQCEGTGKTAHALIKTRHIWISKPSIRASSVKGLKCNLGASGMRWKWHNFCNFQVFFPRQKILSWPEATIAGCFKLQGPPCRSEPGNVSEAWWGGCGPVRGSWCALRRQNALFEIFLVVRELSALGAKDSAHVHRGEPTSCRYEVDLRTRGRGGEKGHVESPWRMENGRGWEDYLDGWGWALASLCEQKGGKQDWA